MRVFAISDLHIDYAENRDWLFALSESDYTEDILILAGDITDIMKLQIEAFEAVKKRFREVLFVVGNHDLWVMRDDAPDSLAKYSQLLTIAADHGIRTEPYHLDSLSIVPLTAWYDYSFGKPSENLLKRWIDFSACKWPAGFDEEKITEYFLALNEPVLDIRNQFLITFSHFLPRIDLMPPFIPEKKRFIYPVLGSLKLDEQVRQLQPNIHVYGHSHVNTSDVVDNIWYINNAFGYPSETRITRKYLLQIYET